MGGNKNNNTYTKENYFYLFYEEVVPQDTLFPLTNFLSFVEDETDFYGVLPLGLGRGGRDTWQQRQGQERG